jgi:methylenetetrahydrofolate dehydrogenase (NADP+) / methenyltetrahydrofolate cyclohydrolase
MEVANNKLLKGADLAAKLLMQVAKDAKDLKSKDVPLGIAFISIGEDPASKVYLTRKRKIAASIGIESIDCNFNENTSTEKLIYEIEELNKRKDVTGILVQLPIPKSIDSFKAINAIDPKKDVDGFTVENIGRLITKQKCLVPCTPQGCVALIKSVEQNISGAHAVIIGRSHIVGRPLSELLLQENCSVTVLHSRSKKPEEIARTADILISAVGEPKLVHEGWVKPGAIVIDVGITRAVDENGKKKLIGDVDFENVINKVKAITPVPGGVGPMTIAYLMKNTIDAAKLFI